MLATGDEVIKFWKVNVGGEVCALLSPSSYVLHFYSVSGLLDVTRV